MDMDDDFMGEIEFDLTASQQEVVNRAIGLAAQRESTDSFAALNPLISIMQWWEEAGSSELGPPGAPEDKLVAICREFVRAHANR